MTPIAQLADELGRGQTVTHRFATLFRPGHQFARQRHCVGVLIRFAIMPDVPHDHEHLARDRHKGFFAAQPTAEIFKAGFPMSIVTDGDPRGFDHRRT